MLYLEHNPAALKYHTELMRCWLLIKIKGRKGPTYKHGHQCGISTCPICSVDRHIDNKIPKAFKTFLLKKKNLETLISGRPNDLRLLNLRYKKLGLSQADRKAVKKFFVDTAYTNWYQPEHSMGLLKLINKNTCLYCNRNYSRTIQDLNGKKVISAEIDHWFVKEKFPILAVSFYNLIPSCHSCNSSIKGNPNIKWDRALRNYVHPYQEEKKQDFKFSYIHKSKKEYNVKIEVVSNSKIANTLKLFKIEEIYDSHSDLELRDLLDLRHKYSENYIDMLVNKTFKGIMDPEDIYRYIFGIESTKADYHKRSLSKFKYDIIQELLKIK
ncbi:MAG: hypothetical protein ACLGH8_14350 [Bacteroidia bacterium]